MDVCKEKEPKVINNALLEKCVLEQGPKGEAGRLAGEEGVHLEDVERVTLEFRNLLKIDHLWFMKSLTTLGLNNNLIEKIENLETLVNLRELDLSFNKIARIENLNALVNLRKLLLYDNQIYEIENMDGLTALNIFSVGRNRIADVGGVLYLRRFPNLRSLNMEGNPCTHEDNFRLFVAVFLHGLVYYEYRMITPKEREEGLRIFGKTLASLEEKETKEREKNDAELQVLADAERNAKSFVEYLNTSLLFDSLFENDEEGIALVEIGEEVEELLNNYREQFIQVCQQIFNNGQDQYNLRRAEIDQFERCVVEAKRSNQAANVRTMDEFNKKRDEIFKRIGHLQFKLDENDINMDEYEDLVEQLSGNFERLRYNAWTDFMRLELEILEQIEEVNQTFEHALSELVNGFVETSQGFFSQLRALEVDYAEQVSEAAQRYLTNANLTPGFAMPHALRTIMADKEAIVNAVSGSHDQHLQIVDNREDRLIGNAREWLAGLVENLQREEITRNRSKVMEIVTYLDLQKERFDEMSTIVPIVDPDDMI